MFSVLKFSTHKVRMRWLNIGVSLSFLEKLWLKNSALLELNDNVSKIMRGVSDCSVKIIISTLMISSLAICCAFETRCSEEK